MVARLLKRLLLPVNTTGEIFTCKKGFDLRKLFRGSVIFNLGENGTHPSPDHSRPLRRFHAASQGVAKWRLRRFVVWHEVSSLIGKGKSPPTTWGDPFFLRMVKQARNFGLKFAFADQVPQSIERKGSTLRKQLLGLITKAKVASIGPGRPAHDIRLTPEAEVILKKTRK